MTRATRYVRWATLCLAALARAAGAAGAAGAQEAEDPGNTLVPLPVLFYQPETGTGFGAAVTYYFRPAGATIAVPPSEIGVVGIYTSRRQIIALLNTQLSRDGGLLRFSGQATFLEFPTKFWGVGNDTPESAAEDYTPRTVGLEGELQRAVADGWFLGGSLRVAHRSLREVADTGALASGAVPGSADGRVIVAGFLLSRDTRSSTVYPRRGAYDRARVSVSDGTIGSNFEYAGLTLDMRRYTPVWATHVVALRVIGETVTGTPPFDLLPQLGGDQLLRGYYSGRFRDKSMVAVQTEYRLPVWWRIGVVGFLGAGQVRPEVGDFTLDGFKVAAGGGLRFQLSRQENLNIRADFGHGFAVGSTGFYLSIGEAF